MLTRNILMRGSESSIEIEKGPGIRIEGQGRISGVMGYRMGQKNVIEAYPFHFHLQGEAPHSYITYSSVYKSYFRGMKPTKAADFHYRYNPSSQRTADQLQKCSG